MKKFLFVLFAMLCMRSAAFDMITAGGKPAADIVIDCSCKDKKNCPVEFAAQELQLWIQKISGAELKISAAPDPAMPLHICIGTPALSNIVRTAMRPDDSQSIGKTDGFVIRKKGKKILIAGMIPKGALNGVYQFLNDNTDIVFVRPLEAETGFGTVFSKTPDIPLKHADVRRIPAFPEYRYFTANVPEVHLWQTRLMNRSNINRRLLFARNAPSYRAWGVTVFGGAHSFNVIIPPVKYSKTKPFIYPQLPGKDGKLTYKWNNWFDTFLCWTSDEAFDTFMEAFMKEVDDSVRDGAAFIEIPHGDTDAVCRCENCVQDVKKNGKIIAKYVDANAKDAHMSNHGSTRYYMFINRVAKKVAEKYPDLRLRGMAYWITRIAPAVPLEPNIDIFWAPYKKTLRLPMTDPRLRIDRYNYPDTFEQWRKVLAPSAHFQLYEYQFCTQPAVAPNPVSDVIAEDLRFYLAKGRMNGAYFDSNGWDNKNTFRDGIINWERSATYDSSAMEFWVTSRLMWDPNLDPEILRDEFCRRAFHAAAPEMRAFYRLFREGWKINQSFLAWNAGGRSCFENYIHLFDNGGKATALLKQALKKVDNPASRALIERQYNVFEHGGGTMLNIHYTK